MNFLFVVMEIVIYKNNNGCDSFIFDWRYVEEGKFDFFEIVNVFMLFEENILSELSCERNNLMFWIFLSNVFCSWNEIDDFKIL